MTPTSALPVPTADAPLARESGVSGLAERIEGVDDGQHIPAPLRVDRTDEVIALGAAALNQILFGTAGPLGRRERN